MIEDSILQLLLILAYLAIGLIAITFPIYTICVAFLPVEKLESEKERENRLQNLRVKISQLTENLVGTHSDSEQVTQLKEQIRRYEDELRGTTLRFECLTARGAVGSPVVYLTLALLAAGVGIYSFNLESLEGVVVFGFMSGLCSAMAVRRLYRTVLAIEYAALRPARTVDFKIAFADGTTRLKLKLGKSTRLNIFAHTQQQDVENLRLFAELPLELEAPPYDQRDPKLEVTKYPSQTLVCVDDEFLPKGVNSGFGVWVTPKKVGEYVIPVKIYGKGIYEVEKEVVVAVVK